MTTARDAEFFSAARVVFAPRISWRNSLGGAPGLVRAMPAACVGLDANSVYTGPEMVYSISVPPGQVLRVSLHTTTDWDSALAIVVPDQCKTVPAACLGAADRWIGSTTNDETAIFKNTDATAKDVRIIVEGLVGMTAPGEFTLAADVGAPVSGDTCASPIRTDGGAAGFTVAGTLVGAFNDLAPTAAGCPGLDDRVTAYTSPAGFAAKHREIPMPEHIPAETKDLRPSRPDAGPPVVRAVLRRGFILAFRAS